MPRKRSRLESRDRIDTGSLEPLRHKVLSHDATEGRFAGSIVPDDPHLFIPREGVAEMIENDFVSETFG